MSEDEIAEIKRRLDRGDQRFETLEANLRENTEATQRIAENTAGIVRLITELEAGMKFLCRAAMMIRFVLKEIVEPFWKPALIVGVVVYYITHGQQFPLLIDEILKLVVG